MSRLFVLTLLSLAVLPMPAAQAGPKYDALIAEVLADRNTIALASLADPKAEALRAAAVDLLDEALAVHTARGLAGGEEFFAYLGKGLVTLKKAADRVRPDAFSFLVDPMFEDLWVLAVNIFTPGLEKTVDPGVALGKKLAPASKLAGKQQYAKAVGKLAKAWDALMVVDPNP